MSTRKRTITGPGFLGTSEEFSDQEEIITEEISVVGENPVEEETAPAVEETVKLEKTPEPIKLVEKPKPKRPEVVSRPVTVHTNPKPNTPADASAPRRNIPRFLR